MEDDVLPPGAALYVTPGSRGDVWTTMQLDIQYYYNYVELDINPNMIDGSCVDTMY